MKINFEFDTNLRYNNTIAIHKNDLERLERDFNVELRRNDLITVKISNPENDIQPLTRSFLVKRQDSEFILWIRKSTRDYLEINETGQLVKVKIIEKMIK